MSLFETKIPINQQEVAKIVNHKWRMKVQKILKASQNYTYQGTFLSQGQIKFSIRVTPDPENKHFERIKNELAFVKFCVEHKLLHACAPIPIKDQNQSLYVKIGDLIIVVFEWARGQPINFFQLKWMTDVSLMRAWGRYFAQLHKISKLFTQEYPQIAKKIQNWNEIHHGVLSKIKLVEQDQKDIDNPKYYGVIHGDINISNFYYNRESDYLSVFDTDQTQRGFYQWDLAQAIFGVVMLQQAGMPISGNPVPEANRRFFQQNLIKGYQSVAGQNTINKARLSRMVDMKRQFYRLFCTQAIEEGNIPKDMQGFIMFIANSFKKQKLNQIPTIQKTQKTQQQNKYQQTN